MQQNAENRIKKFQLLKKVMPIWISDLVYFSKTELEN